VLPASVEDVTIRPLPPKPSLFLEPSMAEPGTEAEYHEQPRAFIPPQAERPATRQVPRMPRIDELPMPVQNEMRAQRGELTEDHPENRRKSLLQRLASVGLGRREEAEPQERHMQRPVAPPMGMQPRPAPRLPESRPAEPISEYARRPAPQGLDMHGRPAPVHKSAEDDQLDIPAFLRRQAN
jgi:cell division protein FtsZ